MLCSPLQRARQTCELAGFGNVAELCDDLPEWNYGDYEGLTTPADPRGQSLLEPLARWLSGRRESAAVGARADRVLERFAASEGDALAFAHGHILRVLTARWLEMEVAAGARFALATAGVSVLGHERDAAVIDQWNV